LVGRAVADVVGDGVGDCVFVGAGGGGLLTGGGFGSPSLGGIMDVNVPIGVGVGANSFGVGVGASSPFGVGGLITRGVGVGPLFGVSITSATSWSGTSVGTAVESGDSGVVVEAPCVGDFTTVGAAIEVHCGGTF
jgi:hypothetical protein